MITGANSTSSVGRWVVVPIALAVTAIAVPYLLTHGYAAAAFTVQSGYALICHQRPERTFSLFGGHIAVCARCLGIYLGAAIGLLLRTTRQQAMSLLILAGAFNLLDGLTELVGLHGNWLAVRFVLGLALGTAGALLISSSTQSSALSHPR